MDLIEPLPKPLPLNIQRNAHCSSRAGTAACQTRLGRRTTVFAGALDRDMGKAPKVFEPTSCFTTMETDGLVTYNTTPTFGVCAHGGLLILHECNQRVNLGACGWRAVLVPVLKNIALLGGQGRGGTSLSMHGLRGIQH